MSLILENVSKLYEHIEAICDFSMEIKKGECLVLFGPSGSGKSSVLKMISGDENITKGTISVNNTIINNIHKVDRNIAIVYQTYLLNEEQTIFNNISYFLKKKRNNRKTIKEKVLSIAKELEIEDILNNYPLNCSGGERQRAAIAKVLLSDAEVLLFDEPLANMEPHMRIKIKKLILKTVKEKNSICIYATHDQNEAMTIGNKMVILQNGRIAQVGKPLELYNNPQNMFVAKSLGFPSVNIFHVVKKNESGCSVLLIDNQKVDMGENRILQIPYEEFYIGVRSEAICLSNIGSKNSLSATMYSFENYGSKYLVTCRINKDSPLISAVVNEVECYKIAEQIFIEIDFNNVYIFDKDERRI